MNNEIAVTGQYNLVKHEELAAQIVGLMEASFARPEPEEMLAILDAARGQVRGRLVGPKSSPIAS